LVAATLSPPAAFAARTPGVAATGSGAKEHVIVLLRDQHQNVPATPANARRRVALTDSDQSPLISKARGQHATGIRQLHVVNAFSVTASPSEVSALAADPAVASVVPDRQVRLPVTDARPTVTGPRGKVSSKTCPTNPSKPLLEPQALQLTHTAYRSPSKPSAQQLVTGSGVRVAFLADGLDVNNPDFIRPDGSHVFIDYQDFSGDGPLAPTDAGEAFGDASSIAAQGRETYDLADYVNPAHPLPQGCTIQIRGMAPGASLVGLKVFPAGGFAFNSAILAALDYAVTVDKVDVVNESFGSNQYPDTNDDPTAMFNEQLVAAGITVVASSGDAGGESTIGSPASTPGVISVGGTTSFRTYAQTTEAGFQLGNGKYASNNISGLSSSGVTQPGRTIDLVAPGDLGWALCTPDPDVWQACSDNKGDPSPIEEFGGTSQSTPLVAGAVALVIQAYRQTHHGSSPAPALVKQLLTGTADDLGLPGTEQGAGLLDSLRAVQAARSVHGSTAAPSGDGLLVSPTQLDVTARSGSRTTQVVKVTNTGRRTAVLTPSLRSQSRVLRQDDFSPTLSPATDPTFVDSFGTNRAYTTQTFTVPRGTDRLTGEIAWPDSSKLVRLVLLDPTGTFTAYTIPQGLGSYGLADVRTPRPGRWTAVLWTAASASGFTGSVDLTTTSFRDGSVGSVRPRVLVVPSGATRSLEVSIPAGDAGDLADALQLAPADRKVGGAVPVVVRTLVATNSRGGTFAGTFGGGNGRAGIPSPSRSYEFNVPAHAPDLAVSLSLGRDATEAVYGFLIDPNGEPVSEKTNQSVDSGGDITLARSLQFDHRAPQAGQWRLVFAVFGPVAGTSTSTAYSGQVQYGLAQVTSTGVPNRSSTVLAAGRPVTAQIHVTNRGAAADAYFADARATDRSDVTLKGRNAAGYTMAPAPLSPFPAFIVPTETSALTITSTSDRPVAFEASPFPADHVTDLSFEGDPDREAGPAGLSPSVTIADPIVAAQTWLALPSQIGPFTSTAPTSHTSFAAVAHTAAFDPAVTSSSGDPMLASVNDPAPAAAPLQLAAGANGAITVTITPSAPSGTTVRGVLYLDTYDAVTGSADEIAAIPYTYKVG
jgi:hypothetical protein